MAWFIIVLIMTMFLTFQNDLIKQFLKLKMTKQFMLQRQINLTSIVILNKSQYKEKMNNLLNDNTTYIILNKNPLDKCNSYFNSSLRKILKNDSS